VAVDDGSRDDTPAILRGYEPAVQTIRLPLTGHAAALNRGITAATSTWVAFVDADDEWTAGALAVRWARVVADPTLDLVSGRVVQFVSPDLPADTQARFRFDPSPSRAQVFGAVLVRRAVLLDVGLLDERLPSASTIDWISRARVAGVHIEQIDDVVLRRRLHESNMGVVNDDEVTRRALRDVVRAHHARRQDRPS
jgi:glycosyltransferase involved in cell wall biosynthesis